MKAADILNRILAGGLQVQGAVVQFMQNGGGRKFDAVEFLTSPEFAGIAQAGQDLLEATGKDDMDDAIADVDSKIAALLNGRQVSELRGDDLINYANLTSLKLQFAGIGVRNAMDAEVVDFLVSRLLPALVELAPKVLPLLI